ADREGGLRAGVERAREILEPVCFSSLSGSSSRGQAIDRLARDSGARAEAPALAITQSERLNAFGIPQAACLRCGDCLAGCRYGAANTVAQTWLQDAWQHCADIFTGIVVRRVERTFDGRRWRVYYATVSDVADSLDAADERFVTADCVVLSAGALGTTEILLRSAEHGLSLSRRLGQRFSGNGNQLGAVWNSEWRAGMTGVADADSEHPVGAATERVIDLREGQPLNQQLMIQDVALPGALARDCLAALSRAEAGRERTLSDSGGWLRRRWRKWRDRFGVSDRGALAHSLLFLAIGHDSAAGSVALTDDRLEIHWPGVAAEAAFDQARQLFRGWAKRMGGIPLSDIHWVASQPSPVMTWHPLGGCAMGDDVDAGVVDHAGRVFRRDEGGVHEGLYVADGSMLPMSLGVGPALTIAALAERNVRLIARDMGWTISEAAPIYSERLESESVSARIERRMQGYWLPDSGGHADFRIAAETGRDHGHFLEASLVMEAKDLEQALTDETLTMTLSGDVFSAPLGGERLRIRDGKMSLALNASDASRQIEYQALLEDSGGRQWRFRGLGQINPVSPRLMDESTQLYITIEPISGDDQAGNGVIGMEASELTGEMARIAISGAESREASGQWLARLGSLFHGPLWAVYGPALLSGTRARFLRPLRCGHPEWHGFEASDGTPLQLLRYPGAGRPVLLIHRPGASSRVYSLDALNTCLVEDLCETGRDVWLLDDRSSVFHGHRETPTDFASIDTLAETDYSEAIARVLEISGERGIDLIADGAAADLVMASMVGASGIDPATIGAAILIQPAAPGDGGGVDNSRISPAIRSLIPALYSGAESSDFRRSGELLDKALRNFAGEALPAITMIHGEKTLNPANERVLRLLRFLRENAGARGFGHHVVHDYDDIDCLIGSDASVDVYPLITRALDAVP
ncbi:MAG TPA: GMC family oxidoreductase, partial [Gammaproteobacteria bacterium]|nr:GMC family oxidoreductase [Gammaproteobacteria bacterium]